MASSKTNHRTRVGRQRSARTEGRILEAALGVFAQMGPDAPKIDDFVAAAGISRGTFYNHFESVDELLKATSEWTTRETIGAIERALEGVRGPVLRLGIGSRLFLRKAQADRVWSLFVGRVWQVGGHQLPERDLEEGARLGVLRIPSLTAARDVWFGGTREALLRIGSQRTPAEYGSQVTEVLLQAVGADSRRIASVLEHDLPALVPAPARATGPASRASSSAPATMKPG
jgi:AcrR family transcriptional regulator